MILLAVSSQSYILCPAILWSLVKGLLDVRSNFNLQRHQKTGTSILSVVNRSSTICWECAHVGQHNMFWKFWNIIKIADLGGQGFPTFSACMASGESFILVMVNAKPATRKSCFKFFSKFSCQSKKNAQKHYYTNGVSIKLAYGRDMVS